MYKGNRKRDVSTNKVWSEGKTNKTLENSDTGGSKWLLQR